MKILEINKYYYPKGGAETVFFNTIELLQENGHEVIPFCLTNKKNKSSQYAQYFINFPELSESSILTRAQYTLSFFYNKESASHIESLIIKEKPDIAHIHLLFNGISVSILPVLKKYRIPIVMTVHDYRLICPAYTFTDGKQNICERCIVNKRYYQCITNQCSKGNMINSTLLALEMYYREKYYQPINYIDKFIFVSKFALQKHIQADPAYKKKSTLLYNFTPNKEHDINKKKNYFLYFGRISEEKGIQTLINAAKELPSIHFKIAGTGPLLCHFQAQNIPNISFVGFKQGNELENLIQQAKFVIVPSEWFENNPLSIIESMMSGTPVIGSNIGGIPELITNNVTGFLFETKNKNALINSINQAVLLDRNEYELMCKNAYTFAKNNFSPKVHLSKLITIYHETINNYI